MSLNAFQRIGWQFSAVDSRLHRISAGWKMAGMLAMCSAAFIGKSFPNLLALLALNVIGYRLGRVKTVEMWKDMRFFMIQTVIVVALYVLRDGIYDGVLPGLRTSLQILLFFMPGALFLRVTPSSQLMRSLRRWLPERIAFFVFISFRFIPYFAREISDISMAQQLRGARIDKRSLANPRNWPGLFHCLMVPLMIRVMKTAEDAALSAEARGFGKTGPSHSSFPVAKECE